MVEDKMAEERKERTGAVQFHRGKAELLGDVRVLNQQRIFNLGSV